VHLQISTTKKINELPGWLDSIPRSYSALHQKIVRDLNDHGKYLLDEIVVVVFLIQEAVFYE
jgi:hypothetical protein